MRKMLMDARADREKIGVWQAADGSKDISGFQ